MEEETNYKRLGFCTFKTEDLYLMAALSVRGIQPRKVRNNTKGIISAVYDDTEQNKQFVQDFYDGQLRYCPLRLKQERLALKETAKSQDNPFPYPHMTKVFNQTTPK